MNSTYTTEEEKERGKGGEGGREGSDGVSEGEREREEVSMGGGESGLLG